MLFTSCIVVPLKSIVFAAATEPDDVTLKSATANVPDPNCTAPAIDIISALTLRAPDDVSVDFSVEDPSSQMASALIGPTELLNVVPASDTVDDAVIEDVPYHVL